jgi:hypothetical protein
MSTHHERTNAVQLRNRRLGISQAGIVQAIQKLGVREYFNWCDKGYWYLRDMDISYSKWFCIPTSSKLTTVKPGGSVPLLPGAFPGIHFPVGEYLYRTMRFDKSSPEVEAFKKAGYRVEDNVVDESSVVVYFPVEEKDFVRARKDISIWEQVELAAQTNYWWSDNAVSCTVTFSPEEAGAIPDILQLYETRLKSISFMPLDDHGYEQAPLQPITEAEYKKAISKLKKLDLNNPLSENFAQKEFCDSDSCTIK